MTHDTVGLISSAAEDVAAEKRATRDDRWYVAFLLACVLIMIMPIWLDLGGLPVTHDQDATKDLASLHVMNDAVGRYHEYPLWNPYIGGGIPWAGYIYNPGVSPQSLLYIVFGEVVGVKLWLFAIMFLGSYGMYGTARGWLGLTPSSALTGSLFYATSSWLGVELNSGNYDVLGYFILPFVALCMLRLLQGRLLGLLLPFCYMTALADAAKWWPFIIGATVLIVSLAYRAESGRTLAVVAPLGAGLRRRHRSGGAKASASLGPNEGGSG